VYRFDLLRLRPQFADTDLLSRRLDADVDARPPRFGALHQTDVSCISRDAVELYNESRCIALTFGFFVRKGAGTFCHRERMRLFLNLQTPPSSLAVRALNVLGTAHGSIDGSRVITAMLDDGL
jgi:hypothetical protein